VIVAFAKKKKRKRKRGWRGKVHKGKKMKAIEGHVRDELVSLTLPRKREEKGEK